MSAALALLLVGGAASAGFAGWLGRAGDGGLAAESDRALESDGALENELAALAGLDSATLLERADDPRPARAAAARILLARGARAEEPQAALALLAPLPGRLRRAEEELPRLFLRMDAGESVDPRDLSPATRSALQERARSRLSRAVEAGDLPALVATLGCLREAGADSIPPPTLDRLLALLSQQVPPGSMSGTGPCDPQVARVLRALDQTGARSARGPGAEQLARALEALLMLGSQESTPWEWLEAACGLDLDLSVRFPRATTPPPGFPRCAAIAGWYAAVAAGKAPPRGLLDMLGPVQRARWILWSGGDVREAQRLDPDGPAVLLELAVDDLDRVDRPRSVAALDRLLRLLSPLTSVGVSDPLALARAQGVKRLLEAPLQREALERGLQRVRAEQPVFGRALAEGFMAAGVLERVDPLERQPARVR